MRLPFKKLCLVLFIAFLISSVLIEAQKSKKNKKSPKTISKDKSSSDDPQKDKSSKDSTSEPTQDVNPKWKIAQQPQKKKADKKEKVIPTKIPVLSDQTTQVKVQEFKAVTPDTTNITQNIGLIPREAPSITCIPPSVQESEAIKNIKENVTSLWSQVNALSQPVHVHVHGGRLSSPGHRHECQGRCHGDRSHKGHHQKSKNKKSDSSHKSHHKSHKKHHENTSDKSMKSKSGSNKKSTSNEGDHSHGHHGGQDHHHSYHHHHHHHHHQNESSEDHGHSNHSHSHHHNHTHSHQGHGHRDRSHVKHHNHGHSHGGHGHSYGGHGHSHGGYGHSHGHHGHSHARGHGHRRDRSSTEGRGHSTHIHVHVTIDERRDGEPQGTKRSNVSDLSPAETEIIYAKCAIPYNNNPGQLQGYILLRQVNETLQVRVNISGFSVEQEIGQHDYVDSRFTETPSPKQLPQHGFHVHEFGDISQGCASFGGHYNPDGTDHGGIDHTERHVGDWGNLEIDADGTANKEFYINDATLRGRNSIIGRGIVIHGQADDLGEGDTAASKASGNAGARLACCIIGITKPDPTIQ